MSDKKYYVNFMTSHTLPGWNPPASGSGSAVPLLPLQHSCDNNLQQSLYCSDQVEKAESQSS